MLPAAGPGGAAHGFDPDMQTCPTTLLPSGTPFTDHVTVASGVFATIAANDPRCMGMNVADGGEMLTATLLVTVTVLEAIAVPAVA
jgi:hypothetical protein